MKMTSRTRMEVINCPICDKAMEKGKECPHCGFPKNMQITPEAKKALKKMKRIINLPPEKMKKELSQIERRR